MTTTVAQKLTTRLAAKTLKDAVALAASGLPKRTELPILYNLLLATADGGAFLSVTGMDLEIGVKTTVPTGVLLQDAAQDYAVCVNGAKLSSFVASLPDHQPVTLEVDEKALVVTCARARGRYPLVDAEEYPPFPGTKGVTPVLTAMGTPLGRALASVLPFVATTKERPVLMGVYVEVAGTEMTVMGADGIIIAMHRALDYGVPDGKRAEFKRDATLVLSRSGAARMAAVATGAGESRGTFSVVGPNPDDPNGARLDVDHGSMAVSVFARALAEPYPAKAIRTIFPQPSDYPDPSVKATGALLATAIRRAAIFGPDSAYGAPIVLTVAPAGYEDQGTLTVRASGAQEGEGVDVLDCTAMTGEGDPLPEPIYAKVGSGYLLDAIAAVRDTTGSEDVYLGFRDRKAFTVNDGTHDFRVGMAPLEWKAGERPEAPAEPEAVPDEPAEPAEDEIDLDEFAAEDEAEDLSEA